MDKIKDKKNKKEKEVIIEDNNFKFEEHLVESGIAKILNQTTDPIILNTLGTICPINTVILSNWNILSRKRFKKYKAPKIKYVGDDYPSLPKPKISKPYVIDNLVEEPINDMEWADGLPTFGTPEPKQGYPKSIYTSISSELLLNKIKELNTYIKMSKLVTANNVVDLNRYTAEKDLEEISYELMLRGVSTTQVEKEPETYASGLEAAYTNFINNYGQNPALLKGYIINNKVISTNEELIELINSGSYIGWDKAKMLIRVFSFTDKGIESKLVTRLGYKVQKANKEVLITPILPILVRFKIKSFDNSNKFFNNTGIGIYNRSTLENLETTNWNLLQSVKLVRNKEKFVTDQILIEHPDNKEEIRFVFSDCIFINPDLNGYNAPVDKTININSIVTIKESRLEKYNISREINSLAEVVAIKPNPSSKQIAKNCRNSRLDVITIRLNSNQRTVQTYAQDLRFIKNKEQVNNIQNDNTIKKESIKAKSLQDYWQEQASNYIYTTTGNQTFTSTHF